ncbi:hypothetical protein F5Y03DRAFT_410195 [Xylaria venustula]|nr:hypothetical protein F5Y03DRAFT_410195 [Xylaria venustula]
MSPSTRSKTGGVRAQPTGSSIEGNSFNMASTANQQIGQPQYMAPFNNQYLDLGYPNHHPQPVANLPPTPAVPGPMEFSAYHYDRTDPMALRANHHNQSGHMALGAHNYNQTGLMPPQLNNLGYFDHRLPPAMNLPSTSAGPGPMEFSAYHYNHTDPVAFRSHQNNPASHMMHRPALYPPPAQVYGQSPDFLMPPSQFPPQAWYQVQSEEAGSEPGDEPAGRRIKKAKKDKDDGEKKPPNSFMCYRRANSKRVRAENPDKSNGQASKIIALTWRDLSDAEKQPYRDEADELSRLHKLARAAQRPIQVQPAQPAVGQPQEPRPVAENPQYDYPAPGAQPNGATQYNQAPQEVPLFTSDRQVIPNNVVAPQEAHVLGIMPGEGADHAALAFDLEFPELLDNNVVLPNHELNLELNLEFPELLDNNVALPDLEFPEPLDNNVALPNHELDLEFPEPLDNNVVIPNNELNLEFPELLDNNVVISNHELNLEFPELLDNNVAHPNHELDLEFSEPLDNSVVIPNNELNLEFSEPLDNNVALPNHDQPINQDLSPHNNGELVVSDDHVAEDAGEADINDGLVNENAGDLSFQDLLFSQNGEELAFDENLFSQNGDQLIFNDDLFTPADSNWNFDLDGN